VEPPLLALSCDQSKVCLGRPWTLSKCPQWVENGRSHVRAYGFRITLSQEYLRQTATAPNAPLPVSTHGRRQRLPQASRTCRGLQPTTAVKQRIMWL
jgi:hypothetical protein